uniref:Uncharacterized protein n=1 Tax=viral metagenome TaxID=1070528 RepID=A0A6C0FBF3_9ZZZZ|tara:strand:- start:54508 stop:54861 length:354 start_codon:yes stop_codon:yes gene_type:complete
MENTKEILVKNIRQWVKLDNEIRALKKEENQRKNEKKEINNTLIEVMKNHEIDCIDIKDGQLCYTKKNVKKPITKKALLNILAKYFEGDIEKAEEANEFILNNREEVIKESITRKLN